MRKFQDIKKPTRKDIISKLKEFDRVGREAFLYKYANGVGSKSRKILYQGQLYDMKAVWASAHSPPISTISFNSSTPWSELPKLGFTHVYEQEHLDGFLQGDLSAQVKSSMEDDPDKRQKRLEKAPRKPKKIKRTTTQFHRNPDVIAEVLIRAKGRCENCKNPAPFKKKSDGEPYLEVHHIVMLAEGGDDTVKNAIALCPNCHRQKHFGKAT